MSSAQFGLFSMVPLGVSTNVRSALKFIYLGVGHVTLDLTGYPESVRQRISDGA